MIDAIQAYGGWCLLAFSCLLLLSLFMWPLFFMNVKPSLKGVVCIPNIPYDHNPRHMLDVYMPKSPVISSQSQATLLQKPVLVFIHGGAWDFGDKCEYQFAGAALAELGHICVVPNYRLFPEVVFPHFIHDVAKAVDALPAILAEHVLLAQPQSQSPIQPVQVVLIGHSAGAHTAAMLSCDKQYITNPLVQVIGCIGLAGPYDLPLDDPLVVGKFDGVQVHEVIEQHVDAGHVHNQHDANPINLANEQNPPMVLIHGAQDATVGLYHSERFAKRLEQLNIPHRLIVYPKVDHRQIIGGVSWLFRFLNPVYRDIAKGLCLIMKPKQDGNENPKH